MATETVSNKCSIIMENGRYVHRRGLTNGCCGYQPSAHEKLSSLIPQLNALQLVVADEEWQWNETIRQHLMNLAANVAEEINELWDEDFVDQRNKELQGNKA